MPNPVKPDARWLRFLAGDSATSEPVDRSLGFEAEAEGFRLYLRDS